MASLWIVGSRPDSLRVISQATTVLGRGLHDPLSRHLTLADPAVSEPIKGERLGHACVTIESADCYLADLGSTNGTHIVLDDDAILRLAPGQKWRLTDGQIIVCGGSAIIFRVRDDAPDRDEITRFEQKLSQVRNRAASSAPTTAPASGHLGGPTAPIGRR